VARRDVLSLKQRGFDGAVDSSAIVDRNDLDRRIRPAKLPPIADLTPEDLPNLRLKTKS
jgi:hypothetical protein